MARAASAANTNAEGGSARGVIRLLPYATRRRVARNRRILSSSGPITVKSVTHPTRYFTIDTDRAIPAPPFGPHPASHPRLWRGAGAVTLFLATAIVSLLLLTPGYEACRRAFGHDFLAFYAAGTLAREGRIHDLYDLDTVAARQRDIAASAGLATGDAVGPWWNPPVYAWAFAPLSALPFGTALGVWTAINLTAAGIAAWLLGRIIAPADSAVRALAALLVLVSAPFLQSLTHGQNSAISLLLVALAVIAWRADHRFLAGALVGLLMYKPQLAAALALILVLHKGRRAAAGLLAIGAVILLATVITMPGALADYLERLPRNLYRIQVEQTYLWDRHVTLKSFWRLLIQGRGPGETAGLVAVLTFICAIPLLCALPLAAWRARTTERTDALIAATLFAAPLLMPFYFDYDLLLLAVAGALSAAGGWHSIRLWSLLYLWLFVNPYVAGPWRVNLTIPLLSGLALTLADRALHGEQRTHSSEVTGSAPAPWARAA